MNVQVLISCCSSRSSPRGSRGDAAPARGRSAFGVFALLPLLSLLTTSPPAACSPRSVSRLAVGGSGTGAGPRFATVTRWGARRRRKAGVASSAGHRPLGAGPAMRRQAPIVRPSLRPPSIRRADRGSCALLADRGGGAAVPGRVGSGCCARSRTSCWSSAARARARPSGSPGGSSTPPARCWSPPPAPTCCDQTAPLRAADGPGLSCSTRSGSASLASTITFDPLTGCDRPGDGGGAGRRHDRRGAATDTSGDREFWDDQGRGSTSPRCCTPPRWASCTMADVQRWVAEPRRHRAADRRRCCATSPEPAFEAAIAQFINTNDRTQSSITTTITPALGWLTHAPARAAARRSPTAGTRSTSRELLATKARSTCSAARRPRSRRWCAR